MTLQHHQPDIRHQGDGLARGLQRAAARTSCLSWNIRQEIQALRTTHASDPERIEAGKAWISATWQARRKAQANVDAYRNIMAERDGGFLGLNSSVVV